MTPSPGPVPGNPANGRRRRNDVSRPARRTWPALFLCALLIAACGDGPTAATSTTVLPTTTSSVPVTTTEPEPQPAEVSSPALLPDDTRLQDGTWAAVIFRQSLDCIPEDTDLIGAESAECDSPVLFEAGTPGALTGSEVPVWLVRWPVISYALGNGLTTLAEVQGLPSVIETTTSDYAEEDGAISLSGSIPDVGEFQVDMSDEETEFDVPFETGDEPVLSELAGDWQAAGSHLVRIDEGGSYELFELGSDGSTNPTGLVGFVALQDGLLVFPSAAGPPCGGETGVYFGYMIGPSLRLGAVDDACEFRIEAFGSRWSLSSDG